MAANADGEFIAIGFTKEPIPWQAPDGAPVRTLILIVSSSAKTHLRTLSKINYLCEQEILCGLFQSAAGQELIMPYIVKAEGTWA
jgi:PTS system nitrogen regulatory IIA component